MASHKRAEAQIAKKLTDATKRIFEKADKAELKKLLPADLQMYSLCYWADDGCYYCSDDGRNWYVVKCIT